MRIAKLGGALCLMALVTACGATAGSRASGPESPAAPTTSRVPAPPADKGPQCEGGKGPGGVHVLRGGTAAVPGGGGEVTYEGAGADGRHRTAVLSLGGTKRTVTAGQKVALGGHAFTVAQICTYRVVLTTHQTSPDQQGAPMSNWPTTMDGRWRLRWHVPDNGPDFGAVVTDIQDGPARVSINAVSTARGPLAFYRDVRVGETVEIAGRLWKVAAIDPGNMNVDVGSREFRAGHVDLRVTGDA
ncbi:hypothetical protein AB0C59_28875 [Streptomyces sp. NPDC048664]|uniref:hypothetical protein n=1 Tax=Streptomyces sp. NPDC048664 TaxID=3154505 RepID=UPI003412AF5F